MLRCDPCNYDLCCNCQSKPKQPPLPKPLPNPIQSPKKKIKNLIEGEAKKDEEVNTRDKASL